MSVEEVRRLRLKLTAEIEKLVMDFQGQTGCTITSLGVTHFVADEAVEPAATYIEVKVELP